MSAATCCCVCGDVPAADEAVRCSSGRHATCRACLAGWVTASLDDARVREMRGRVRCPWRGAIGAGRAELCDAEPWVLGDIAQHLDGPTLAAVTAAALAALGVAEAEADRARAELRDGGGGGGAVHGAATRAAAAAAHGLDDEERLQRYRRAIAEDVLTLHCPRCRAAFCDYDGCDALTCAAPGCGCNFCALCLQPFKDSAACHAHLMAARHHADGFVGMHGGEARFRRFHAVRAAAAVNALVNVLPEPPALRARLLAALRADLADLNDGRVPAPGAARGAAAAGAGAADADDDDGLGGGGGGGGGGGYWHEWIWGGGAGVRDGGGAGGGALLLGIIGELLGPRERQSPLTRVISMAAEATGATASLTALLRGVWQAPPAPPAAPAPTGPEAVEAARARARGGAAPRPAQAGVAAGSGSAAAAAIGGLALAGAAVALGSYFGGAPVGARAGGGGGGAGAAAGGGGGVVAFAGGGRGGDGAGAAAPVPAAPVPTAPPAADADGPELRRGATATLAATREALEAALGRPLTREELALPITALAARLEAALLS